MLRVLSINEKWFSRIIEKYFVNKTDDMRPPLLVILSNMAWNG